jgi:lactoylglutathione lyase
MSTSTESPAVVPGRPTWQQTMLRVRDPTASLHFYCDILGMTLIDTMDFPQYQFSLYFVTTWEDPSQPYALTPGTTEAHDYLWNMEGVALELTHNHGTETNPDCKGYHTGNQERDGFGHIAVSVEDVYAVSERLEQQAGCPFHKRPNEGRMKGLAFVLDPDGYWVEIVSRGPNLQLTQECNFSQTMLRIKDPKKSLPFYRALGMQLLNERHFDSFSLYFLGSSNVDATVAVKDQFHPVLELTHNHGTEQDADFRHYNGNEPERPGFGHIGFLVDDVYAACDAIRPMGYGFRKEPDGGAMKGLAFCFDPDGYSVELIPRGGLDFGDAPKTAA